ncbi:MAG: hypothetical protein J2P46_09285 [Zavarzinella sp.]|nr:hypothetical protein [Zavarzinella sp.]
MRKYRTDYRMWGAFLGALFLPPWLFVVGACAVEYVWPPDGIVAHDAVDLLRLVGKATVIIAVGAAPVGWLVQALAVMRGDRLLPPPPGPEAIDYDDAPADRTA